MASLELSACGVDVLVTASVLQPFAKHVVGDVVAINPGMAVRGNDGPNTYGYHCTGVH